VRNSACISDHVSGRRFGLSRKPPSDEQKSDETPQAEPQQRPENDHHAPGVRGGCPVTQLLPHRNPHQKHTLCRRECECETVRTEDTGGVGLGWYQSQGTSDNRRRRVLQSGGGVQDGVWRTCERLGVCTDKMLVRACLLVLFALASCGAAQCDLRCFLQRLVLSLPPVQLNGTAAGSKWNLDLSSVQCANFDVGSFVSAYDGKGGALLC
jgi:hypothetical protein